PDPLLMSKKPVEGRTSPSEPAVTAARDPQPPPIPGRDPAGQQTTWTLPPVPGVARGPEEVPVSMGKPRRLPEGRWGARGRRGVSLPVRERHRRADAQCT